jgi:hypothetical protein
MQNFVHKDCNFSRTTLKFSKLVISVRSRHTKMRSHKNEGERKGRKRELNIELMTPSFVIFFL